MASTVRSLSRALLALTSFVLVGLALAAVASMAPAAAHPGGMAGTAHAARKAHTAHAAIPSGPISVDASSSKIDYKTQHVRLSNVVITQGDLKVTADRAEATGLNFKNSRWTFSGNVRINSPDHGVLTSDTATIEFQDEKMQTAAVTGNPAKFEQTVSTTGVLARGHADSIVYTVAADTVQLKGDAWLEYGNNEITGPLLTYDIASQKLQGASAASRGERVHITIRPKPGVPKRGGGPAHEPRRSGVPAPSPRARPGDASSPQPRQADPPTLGPSPGKAP